MLTNQITVENVSASSGNAFVKIDGAIISTTTLGNIHVNSGLGQITVDNETGLPLVVQKIFAGTQTSVTDQVSKVNIIDRNLPDSSNQTLYVYQSGQIQKYTGPASVSDLTTTSGITTALPTTISGTSASYQPETGLRWGWMESASLSRTIQQLTPKTTWSVSNWVWNYPTGQSNNPWSYIDPSTVYYYTDPTSGVNVPIGDPYIDPTLGANAPIGHAFVQSGLPVFQETITGYSFIGAGWLIHYHDGHFGFAGDGTSDSSGSVDPWTYWYPDYAYLALTMSVKADNPIGIDFSGNSTGSVVIDSNGPVRLTDQITNPNGDTTIAAQGSITATANASIVTHDLTLTANAGSIGTVGQPLAATLRPSGVLTATAGNQGVYLNLNSGAIIQQVSAGSSVTGYGNVVINATGDLTTVPQIAPGVPVNVIGNNITLTSSAGAVGSQAAPLDIAANGTPTANGVTGGVVNVNALDDIGLVRDNGDLLIGSIVSIGGNVFVTARNGGLFDAQGTTSAQALSEDQIQAVWSDLHLTADLGAAANANATVTAFENEVNRNYLQYWQLINNGTVNNGTITLTATGLDIFRPRTAAALNIPDPTDDQIQTYANSVYLDTLTFLNANLQYWQAINNGTVSDGTVTLNAAGLAIFGPQTAAALNIQDPTDDQIQAYANAAYQNLVADWQKFNPNYNYVATPYQTQNLTKNSVWTEDELRYAVNATGLGLSSGVPVGSANPNISGRTVVLSSSSSMGRLASAIDVPLADMQDGNLTDAQKAALALATAPGDISLLGKDAQGNTVTFTLGNQPSGVTLTDLLIKQTSPLFVAASVSINVNAGGSAYLQSTAQDLTIDQINTGGLASLTAPGNIQSAGTSSPQIVTGGDLTLVAGNGNVGTSASSPLVIQVGGVLEAAAAGQNVYLQQANHDLNFDRIVAGDEVNIAVPLGGFYQQVTNIPIIADTFTFNVRDGVNGVGAPVEIQLPSTGTISGQTGKDINISSVQGSLTVQNVTSTGGNVALASAHSILDGINRTLGDTSPNIQGQNISLTTGGTDGTIGTASDFLVLHTTVSGVGGLFGTTNNNAYILQDTGDLTVGGFSATFGEVDLMAPHGSILSGGGGTNLSAVKTYLVASQNVGTIAAPLFTSVAFMEGSAQAGSFDISNTGRSVIGGVTNNPIAISAGNGSDLQSHSPWEISKSVNVVGDFTKTGERDDPAGGSNGIVDPNVTIQATGNVFLGAGDNVTIMAGSTILAGGSVTIQSGFRSDTSTPDPEPNVGTTITLAGTITAAQVEVDGSAYNDAINIDRIDSPTTVNGGGGNDTINVGSTVPTVGGVLTTIKQALTVVGNGFATLNVDDTGAAAKTSGVLTATQLTGLGMSVGITYSALGAFNISLGGGGNTFNIQGTAAATTLNSGNGNDAITIDSNGTLPNGTVQGVVSSLTINGQGGSNALTMEDSSAAIGAQVHVTPTQIGADAADNFFGLGGFLTYSKLATVTMNMSQAASPDTIWLTPSNLGTQFYIRGGNPHPPLQNSQLPGDALYLNFTGLTAAQRRGVRRTDTGLNNPADPVFNVWNIPGYGKVSYKQIEKTASFVDTTPPTVQGVPSDGVAVFIDSQTSTVAVTANWAGVFADAQSTVTCYQWKVGTTPGGSELFDFTTIGISGTTASDSSHVLAPGQVYYVTVRAINGVGLESTATSDGVTIPILTPTISNLTVTQWTQGKSGYADTMTIGNDTSPYIVVGKPTGVPPGLTAVLSGDTIRVKGTPSAAGTFKGSITIEDPSGVLITKTFTIKINPPLSFLPATLALYTPGKFYSQTIATAGGTGVRTVSYTLSGPLPAGLTISPPSPTTGAITISGTTSALTSVTLTLTVIDSIGADDDYLRPRPGAGPSRGPLVGVVDSRREPSAARSIGSSRELLPASVLSTYRHARRNSVAPHDYAGYTQPRLIQPSRTGRAGTHSCQRSAIARTTRCLLPRSNGMSYPRTSFRSCLLVLLFAAPVGSLHAQAKPLREVIDAAVRGAWEKEKITPAKPAGDSEFLRRIYLDLAGSVPTYEEAVAFLDSKDPAKREKLIDRLLADPRYAQHQTDVWDMLLFGRRPPGYDTDKREGFQDWMKSRFEKNVPYDAWVRELLKADGNSAENGALYFVQYRNAPEDATEAIAQTFLGVQLQCARCHDHPYESWKQLDFYGMAAFLARLDVVSVGKKGNLPMYAIGEYEIRRHPVHRPGQGRGPRQEGRAGQAEVPRRRRPRRAALTKARSRPGLPPTSMPPKPKFSRKDQLADWITRPDNPYFARAIANRVWAQYLGRGIVHPVDNLSATNKPSIPDLLDVLAKELVAHKFDLKWYIREVVNSRTYQLSGAGSGEAMPQLLPACAQPAAVGRGTGGGVAHRDRLHRGRARRRQEARHQPLPSAGRLPAALLRQSEHRHGHFQGGLHEHLYLNNGPVAQMIGGGKGSIGEFDRRRPVNRSKPESSGCSCKRSTAGPAPAEAEKFAAFLKNNNGSAADAVWVLMTCSEFRFNH